jgi:hypothetical protein
VVNSRSGVDDRGGVKDSGLILSAFHTRSARQPMALLVMSTVIAAENFADQPVTGVSEADVAARSLVDVVHPR